MMHRFITFEGIDGCGKTTQLQRTADWLTSQGYEVSVTREPGDTPLGAEIRHLLLAGEYAPVAEAELLLFLADRAQHVRQYIQPALAAGQVVLCDRYTDSTRAYQMAARRLADGADLSALLAFAECGLQPGLTLWFDLSLAEASRRMQQREAGGAQATRLDQERQVFHQRVATAFADLQRQQPQRIQRVDAAAPIEEVQQQVRTVLSLHLAQQTCT